MNKLFTILLCGLLCAANTTNAQPWSCGDDLTANLAGGTLTISGTGTMTSYTNTGSTIPWYGSRLSITKVVIESGVSSVGYYAFLNCTYLTEVTIQDGLNPISFGNNTSSNTAFNGCTALETVYIGRNISYYTTYSPFRGILTLKTVTMGDNVSSIGSYAFYDCRALSSVTIAAAMNPSPIPIGEYAFGLCRSLTNDVVNHILTKVPTFSSNTFNGCTALTDITIPNTVTPIGTYTFNGCTALKNVTIADGSTSLSFGSSTSSGNTFDGCTSLETVYIGRNISYYTTYSPFRDIPTLKTVTLGENASYIGSYAFRGCTALNSVTISAMLTSMGEYAFSGCGSLTDNVVNHILTKVPAFNSYTFNGCTALTDITIPNTVTNIGTYTFNGCTALKNVTIADELTSLNFGSSTNSGNTFNGCTSLETVYLGRNISYYSTYSPFRDISTLKTVTLGENVSSVGSSAFNGCTALNSVTIPAMLTSMGDYAFYGCGALTDDVVNHILTKITAVSSYNFGGCVGLTDITIPGTMTTVGSYAFYNCTELKNVTIADDLNSLYFGGTSTSSGTIFNGCTVLETIYLGRNTTSNTSYYPPFRGIVSLEKVTLGSNFNTLRVNCFSDCTALNSVTVQGQLTSIGDYAFSGCRALTDDVVNHILTKITAVSSYNFSGCVGLTNIIIPRTITAVGSYAFNNCTELKNVTIADDLNSLYFGGTSTSSGTVFNGCASFETLYMGRNITYNTSYYSPFRGIVTLQTVTMGNNVNTLLSSCFNGCTALNSVTIHGSVTSIGASAFQNCMELPSITIPASTQTIGQNAFNGCEILGEIINWRRDPQSINANVFTGVDKNTCVLKVLCTSLPQYEVTPIWQDFQIKQCIASANFTLTFDAQGGTVTPTGKTVTNGEEIGALPTPVRKGFVFGGWFTQPNGEGTEYTEITEYNISGNTVLYANWTTTGPPAVISVTVSPAAISVAKGAAYQFEVDVDIVDEVSEQVIWSVNSTSGSSMNASGLLTVAAGETAATLTVTAASVFDGTKEGTAVVTVTDIELPEVISVTVNPPTASVQKGQSRQFEADVTVTGGATTDVTWTVNSTSGSSMNASGLLTVAAGETAATLTVTATSVFDGTKKGTAVVTVTDIEVPEVISVTVNPPTASVQKGQSQQFEANVVATGGATTDVTWTVNSTSGSSMNASGLLTVAAGETAATLTVTAASVFDGTKKGTAIVTVTASTSTVTSVTVTPATATLQREQTRQFTANVVATGGASTAVTWSVTGATRSASTISSSGLLSVAIDETASYLTITATSVFDNTKKGMAMVTVSNPAETYSVTKVTVSPATVAMQKGQTQQFTADVVAGGNASADVTWAVTGNTSSGTAIDHSGLLTVAADETTFMLTVTATSVSDHTKKGTAMVTITEDGSITGTEDLLNMDVKLYPNPFDDQLHLTGAEGCTLKVVTESGATVHIQKIVNAGETIRLGYLPAGVYFFRLEKDGKVKTLKTVKY